MTKTRLSLNTLCWQGTYHVDDLTAQCLHAETFNESTGTFVPHSLDGPFWCCNDKVYGGICESGIKVVIQGDRCGECARMDRPKRKKASLGGSIGPADVDFDCVNKPQYGCTEAVSRAGAKCSKCRHLNRPVDGKLALHPNSLYLQDGFETSHEDADFDEGDPFIHNPTRPGDE